MSIRGWIGLSIGVVFVAGFSYLGFALVNHGFSAREEPSRFEEFLARYARKIATPRDARKLQNPATLTPETMQAVYEHWNDHCSICHGLNGDGESDIGKNLYPKTPDMKSSEVQELSDGELFYIITNGVRFTGMPAWGDEHSPEETWQLVSFIRKLPSLTPAELELLKKSTEQKPEAVDETKPHTHTHPPGTPPHKD